MRPGAAAVDNFGYVRAGDVDGALRLAAQPGAQFIAGGTNLLDLMKGRVAAPARLVDITQVAGLAQIHELPDGALRIGALASNSDVAAHPLVRARYPLLSQAILAGASPQLRNMATVGGNLLQRTRCPYFYDIGFSECNKRQPGSGCGALGGFNRNHAILGASESCIATNPSDMNVALAALDATLQIRSPRGSRQLPVRDFHRLPGGTPQIDTNLAPGEIITAVDLPRDGFARHSHYLKLRDRASYAFALVSVAAALSMDEGVVRDVRLVMGGVAHKPWPVIEAQELLVGTTLPPAALGAVAEAAMRGARAQRHNAFKIELGRRAIVRALTVAAAPQEA
jgi:xanthine dehydrogenase YagS FAD-binding subunit